MKRAFLLLATFVLTGMLAVSANRAPVLAQNKAPAAALDPAAVEKIVRDYLLKHPEVVIDAIRAFKVQEKEREEAAVRETIAARGDEIFNDPDSAVGGNRNGDVTLVEFFDYRCGVCKHAHPIISQLLKRDGKIRRVYKEWPILGPVSEFASRAAIASRKQGDRKYLAFHNAMMSAKQVTRESVLALAAKVGLDTGRLERDMQSPEVDSVLGRNFALAKALQLNGTPSFIIGGTLLRGARDLDTMLSIVADERKKG